MYVDRSLRGDTKRDKLIDELNFKKCMQLKRSLKSKFLVGITNKQRKYIIHPDFMVANQEITDAGRVEILYVHILFTTRKEGQVD